MSIKVLLPLFSLDISSPLFSSLLLSCASLLYILQACNKTADCADGLSCTCFAGSGEQVCVPPEYYGVNQCQDALNDLQICLQDNKCYPEALPIPGTCVYENCRAQAAAVDECDCDSMLSERCVCVCVCVVVVVFPTNLSE
jgi:hypothetical protein